jgi:hypothetical protein
MEHPATDRMVGPLNVPVEGLVDLVMDFTDAIIRGNSLFIAPLDHEDRGMAANVVFR